MSAPFELPSIWTTNSQAIISIKGKDRAAFLHNFCTNDIKRLEINTAVEAFVPNIKGKCLGYITVFQTADELLLVTANHKVDELVAHLERYIITEDVELSLLGDATLTLVTGESIESWLETAQPHGPIIPNHWFTQPSYWLLNSVSDEYSQVLHALSDDEVQAARIAAGTPLYGTDISDEQFAQEVNRDALAISFTKGCYLGQEPIARIDALGNVHWYLTRIDISEAEAKTGVTMTSEGKPVVKTRSISTLTNQALAYVKRGQHTSGSVIETDSGIIRVL